MKLDLDMDGDFDRNDIDIFINIVKQYYPASGWGFTYILRRPADYKLKE
jgi:hypothetical protein